MVYTSVKNEEWATTEFVGPLVAGDKVVAGFDWCCTGKLIKVTTGRSYVHEIIALYLPMGGMKKQWLHSKF